MQEYIKEGIRLQEKGEQTLRSIVTDLKQKYGLSQDLKSIERSIQRAKIKLRTTEHHPGLAVECETIGLPLESVKQYWYKGEHYSVNLRGDTGPTYEDVRDEIIKDMMDYAPKYPKIERKQSKDGHLLVIDPADVHIGKLAREIETGDEYNASIAVKRVLEGVQGILDKSSGYNIDKIVFIAGNDILHTDNSRRTTTSGTPQDTDGQWHENFTIARKLYVDVIEMLLSIADVHVVFNPSNHDYVSGYQLMDAVYCWFNKCPNITFDCSIRHRKYFQYGNSLIGTTHGDGAKSSDLGALMAHEVPKLWGESVHRYFYTHHVHHKTSKDYISVTVESLRSPSGTDAWHSKEGYCGVPKAIEGFIHHKEHGQVARLSHVFK